MQCFTLTGQGIFPGIDVHDRRGHGIVDNDRVRLSDTRPPRRHATERYLVVESDARRLMGTVELLEPQANDRVLVWLNPRVECGRRPGVWDLELHAGSRPYVNRNVYPESAPTWRNGLVALEEGEGAVILDQQGYPFKAMCVIADGVATLEECKTGKMFESLHKKFLILQGSCRA